MSVVFDYWAPIRNAYQIGEQSWVYVGGRLTNPVNAVFFHSLFDAGHNGITSFIDWSFHNFQLLTSGSITEWKLQYKETNGTWITFKTGTSATAFGYYEGVINTSITLPIEVRLIATGTGDCNLEIDETAYFYMRAVGLVTASATDITFDHVGALRNSAQLNAASYEDWSYIGERVTDPDEHVFFQSILNSGYESTTTFLEWGLRYFPIWATPTTVYTNFTSIKVQIKETEGEWTTIWTGSGSFALVASGIYAYPHQVVLPIEVRIIGTAAGYATLYCAEGARFFMRAAGTMTPGPTATTTTTTSTSTSSSTTTTTM